MQREHLIRDVELAKQLGCSRRHIASLRARRLIPYVRLGAAIRFDPAAVARALEKLSVKER
jgi:excisionase family DNA binding protein